MRKITRHVSVIFVLLMPSVAISQTPMPGGECWVAGIQRMHREKDGTFRTPTLEECMGPCKKFDDGLHRQCLFNVKSRHFGCHAGAGPFTLGGGPAAKTQADCNRDKRYGELYCEYHFKCQKR